MCVFSALRTTHAQSPHQAGSLEKSDCDDQNSLS